MPHVELRTEVRVETTRPHSGQIHMKRSELNFAFHDSVENEIAFCDTRGCSRGSAISTCFAVFRGDFLTCSDETDFSDGNDDAPKKAANTSANVIITSSDVTGPPQPSQCLSLDILLCVR